MTTFWRIGDQYINPRHIIRIERTAAQPARTVYDHDAAGEVDLPAKPFRMEITLSELKCGSGGWDHNHGYGEYAIPANLVIVISGAEAERFDEWLGDGHDTQYPTAEVQA